MLASHVLDVLNEVETRFPVVDWRVGALRVWPIVRNDLASRVFAAAHAAPAAAQPVRWRRLAESFAGAARVARATFADRAGQASLARGGRALFLSDGISFANVDGRAFEKYCDPMIERLARGGTGALLLTPGAEVRLPRATPSRLIQPRLELISAYAVLAARMCGAKAAVDFPRWDAVARHLEAELPVRMPSQSTLASWVNRVDAMARWFGGVIAPLRPPAGFVVSYYGLNGYAFNLACRRAGVASVDLQHGTPGLLHPAYCRWLAVPDDGFELLPSHFWCWTDADRAAIASSGANFVRHHRPLAGTNLMQDEWLLGEADAVARCDARIAASLGRPGTHKVLLTLQPAVWGAELRARITDAVQRNRDRFDWWVRLHPTMAARGEIETWLRGLPVAFELPSALPLYGLLRATDVHVTYSSSTVVEAEAFGIGSVLLGRYGAEFFPRQIEAGVAVVAESGDALQGALGQLGARRRRDDGLRHAARERLARADATLHDLIARGPGAFTQAAEAA